MTWNPMQYAKFSDHRTRPALDLLARIPTESPEFVVDIGCGTGGITGRLAERWPMARVIGVDGSEEMLSEARRTLPSLEWIRGDLAGWTIEGGADVVFSNASLHWLSDHGGLFARLADQVRPGGTLAVQMPRNFDAPSHTIVQTLAALPRWKSKLYHLIKAAPVQEPGFYYELLVKRFARLELWETEYIQVLKGKDPVLEWIKGTWLRQFLAVLDPDEAGAFERSYAERAAKAYPMRGDGTTILPFRRLFIVGAGA